MQQSEPITMTKLCGVLKCLSLKVPVSCRGNSDEDDDTVRGGSDKPVCNNVN